VPTAGEEKGQGRVHLLTFDARQDELYVGLVLVDVEQGKQDADLSGAVLA
jgi:hypothetical protein